MLIFFYGQGCSHCQVMHPLVEQLEKETGMSVEKLEVWKNPENAAKQKEYDNGICGGVPFFYNTETQRSLCGEVSYEELKNWIR